MNKNYYLLVIKRQGDKEYTIVNEPDLAAVRKRMDGLYIGECEVLSKHRFLPNSNVAVAVELSE